MIRQMPIADRVSFPLAAAAGLVAVVLAGCGAKTFRPPAPGSTFAGYVSDDKRTTLPMFDGRGGQPLVWPQVTAALDWADVVFVGEAHNDVTGHAVELALVEQALARHPRMAVSMEMFERDEQQLVDDYLDDIINKETFIKRTFSASWGGEGMPGGWDGSYQPIVDAVKREPRAALIAANAPRQYVRLARTEGYERLRTIPMPRKTLFNLPMGKTDDDYRRRFFDLMSGPSEETGAAGSEPAPGDEAGRDGDAKKSPPAAHAHSGPMSPQQIEATFRSQLIWDATMAGSIDRALRGGRKRVLHIAGGFHVEFRGGTVQQLSARQRDAKIVTISLRARNATSLLEDDRGRADIVIYTGEPAAKKADDKSEKPASDR